MIRKIVKIDSADKVFLVGDIHGEITKLNEKLSETGFNKELDHLISDIKFVAVVFSIYMLLFGSLVWVM